MYPPSVTAAICRKILNWIVSPRYTFDDGARDCEREVSGPWRRVFSGRANGRRGGCLEADGDGWAGGEDDVNVIGCGIVRIRCARTESEPY